VEYTCGSNGKFPLKITTLPSGKTRVFENGLIA